MSETGQVAPHKYNYEQTLDWAKREPELKEDGSTFLYVFGGIAFLFIFAAILLFSAKGRGKGKVDEPGDVGEEGEAKIEELGSETDATTSEVAVEFDLVEDVKKGKNVKKAAK